MTKEINYEALAKRLHKALSVAKKLGLQVIPRGGYAMDYDINRLPPYPVGLFGALSIVEGPGARSKLDLTYIQTSALEAGFNSVEHYDAPPQTLHTKVKKKDEVYLKLEAIGRELGKKITPRSAAKKNWSSKKKMMRASSISSSSASAWRSASGPRYAPSSIADMLVPATTTAYPGGQVFINGGLGGQAPAPEGINLGNEVPPPPPPAPLGSYAISSNEWDSLSDDDDYEDEDLD